MGNTSMLASKIYRRLNGKYDIKTAGRHGSYDYYMDLTEKINEPLCPEISEQFDVIINCAAVIKGGPLLCELVNAVGAIRIAELCKRIQCPYMMDISTIAAITSGKKSDAYGMSKRQGSQFVRLFSRENQFKYITLRLSSLYDEEGKSISTQALFYHILKTVKAGKELVFWGKCDVKRSFMFADDVVRVIDKAIEKEICGTWNCVHPDIYTLTDIARIAGRVFGKEAKFVFDKTKDDIVSTCIPKDKSIYNQIGWLPEIALETGINVINERLG